MRRIDSLLFTFVRFLTLSVIGAFLVIGRYLLRTPQPLDNTLPGEDRLFSWMYGHIAYKIFGATEAPPLVMFHAPEIGGSSYEFHALIAPLAQHYRVYVPDLLGLGLSDRPDMHYSGETYTTLCQDFLTQVVQKPAIVLASGLSCNYSVVLANTHPELCKRLVLLSPSLLFKQGRLREGVIWLLQQPFWSLLLYAFLTIRVVLRRVMSRQQESAITDDELTYAYKVAHQFGAEHSAIAFLTGQLLLAVLQEFKTTSIPMLLLWGADFSRLNEAVASLYYRNNMAQNVVISHIESRPHKERPNEVVAQIMQWHTSESTQPVATTALDLQPADESIETGVAESDVSAVDGVAETEATIQSSEEDNMSEQTTTEASGEQVEAYCVKCKQKRIMLNPIDTVTKNGRNAKTGTCPVCGTKLFRFVAG